LVPGVPLLLSPHGCTPERDTGFVYASSFTRERSDREVIETMAHDGKDPRNDAHGAAHGESHTALYALMAGAKGCGPAARTARLAQDNELADFLWRVQGEVAEEARRLLAERVAE